MKTRASTRLIEYRPYPHRSERCTIGLLTFLPSGEVKAHLAKNLRKVRAMDPSCDVETLRQGMDRVAAELSENGELLSAYIDGFGPIRVAPTPGYLSYSDGAEYEAAVRWALDVAAEPAVARVSQERAPTSRLFLELKNVFGNFGWLAKLGQGINDHVIVPRYPLSLDEGLLVDFALKNSAMHYLQTVDYRASHHVSLRRTEAQAKALALGLAQQLVPEPYLPQRYFLIAGSHESEAKRTIKLAERVCEHVYAHESASDMQNLLDTISHAMGQDPFPVLTTE